MAEENDFWEQPCEGLEGRYQPVSEAELCDKEQALGIVLPGKYRRLMQLQNGGYVRYSSYYDGEQYHELFINGAKMSPLRDVRGFVSILDCFMSEDEINESADSFEYCYPDRLAVISSLYGHGLICLDYGWLQAHAVTEPAVVVFEQGEGEAYGYIEILRVTNFDQFINGLVYHGYESARFCIGVTAPMTLSRLAEEIGLICGTSFERHDDDCYGWFNFDEYFTGMTGTFLKQRWLYILISPNRFRSGTYLFQNRPQADFIIQIELREGLYSTVYEDISGAVQNLSDQLVQKTGCSAEQLLYPHPFSPS
ncbi:MAG: SMI1/KNR4 family protein [Gammaproteobacteria bacterium]